MSEIDRDVKIDFMADIRDLKKKIETLQRDNQKLAGELDKVGNKGKAAMDKVGSGADGAKRDLAAAAVAIQGMTSQIAGMAQAVLDFDTKILTLQKTIIGVQSQEIALRRMQEDLNTAVNEGTLTAVEYERSIEDIELAFKNMRLEEKVVAAETNKLNGEFVTFGVNAVGTAAQIGIAMKALNISAVGAFGGMVKGIKLVSAAMWTIAKHPVFLIITAGILAWELALKGLVENLTGIDDLGIFSNMQKFFEEAIPTGTDNLEELNNEWGIQETQLRKNNVLVEKQAEGLEKVGKNANRANKELRGLSRGMEINMRAAGFRPGNGIPLSTQLNREADEISAASARTLAAAGLHNALEEAGIEGSLFGSNISGFITPSLQSMIAAGRTRNGFGNSSRVVGLTTGGVSLGGGFAGRSLTRSSRRTRRNFGRTRQNRGEKAGVRRSRNSAREARRLDKEFGFDFTDFTGIDLMSGFKGVRRGNNDPRTFNRTRRITNDRFLAALQRNEAEGRRRIAMFDELREGASREEGLMLINSFNRTRFDFFDNPNTDWSESIKEIIAARNFFNGKANINFEGSTGASSGTGLLLGIREFGFRELNEQLAFQGEELFQTVGT